MVPCKVVKIRKRSFGFILGDQDEVRVRLTETVGAYQKGEELDRSAFRCPPRSMVINRAFSRTIATSYCYAEEASDGEEEDAQAG